MVEDPTTISYTLVSYYQNVLNNWGSFDQVAQYTLLNLIPRVITNDHNIMLNKIFLKEETKEALFQMHSDKALNPYGFKAFFLSEMMTLSR